MSTSRVYSMLCSASRSNYASNGRAASRSILRTKSTLQSSSLSSLRLIHTSLPSSSPTPSSTTQSNALDQSETDELPRHSSTALTSEFTTQAAQRAVSHLQTILSPLAFPPDVALRIVTHLSHRQGAQTHGHNTRMGFIGRRALQTYFMLWLASVSPASLEVAGAKGEVYDFDKLAEVVLHTSALGSHVGVPWKLNEVMLWTSANTRNGGVLNTGVHKVRGATVEAIMGGIFHQFGGVAAQIAFHTRVLPHLTPLLPESLRQSAKDACDALGGPDAPLRQPAQSLGDTSTSSSTVNVHVMTTEGPRRVAAA